MWLAPGEPLESVPRTAAEEGHRVVRARAAPGRGRRRVRLLLEKGAARADAPAAVSESHALTDDRIARYARQLLVPGVRRGGPGAAPRRPRAGGGPGRRSPRPGSSYLVQAGVGRLWLDDPEERLAGRPGRLALPARRGRRAAGGGGRRGPRAALRRSRGGAVPVGRRARRRRWCASRRSSRRSPRPRRRAGPGIPHVVVETDADGGAVVTIPPGAPCYACARSTSGAGRPPEPAAVALSALAAHELLQLIAVPGSLPGRRVELVRGVATARPTARLAGCACAAARGA